MRAAPVDMDGVAGLAGGPYRKLVDGKAAAGSVTVGHQRLNAIGAKLLAGGTAGRRVDRNVGQVGSAALANQQGPVLPAASAVDNQIGSPNNGSIEDVDIAV